MKIERRGIWLEPSPGAAHLYRWRSFWPVLLLVATLLAGSVLALVREDEGLNTTFLRGSKELALRRAFERVGVGVQGLLWGSPVPRSSAVLQLELLLPDGAVEELRRARALGQKRFLKGIYRDESDRYQQGSVSLRGTSYWHHSPVKPSFRVRLKRSEIALGRRLVELSRPEDVLAIKNWLPEQLGRELDLISSLSDHVRLVLNGHAMGLYLRSYTASEALLLEHQRMPGVFFKGDRFDGGDLWGEGLEGWKFDGADPSQADLETFEQFRGLARQGRLAPDQMDQLRAVLDPEQYARWWALVILTGTSHIDQSHNHLYYLSPVVGRLEPVVWDFNGFGIWRGPDVPANCLSNRIQFLASQDPRWVHRRNQVLYNLLNGPAAPAELTRLCQDLYERIEPELRADQALGELERNPVEVPGMPVYYAPHSVLSLEPKKLELRQFIEQRHAHLGAFLQDARVAVQENPDGCLVAVFGNVAVEVTSTSVVTDQWGVESDSMVLYPGLSAQVQLYEGVDYLTAAPLLYQLRNRPEELRFSNALSGQVVRPGPFPDPTPCLSIHPWFFARNQPEPIVWGPGRVELSQDKILAPHQSLRVEPGTTLALAPGVSVLAAGPVSMEGTAEEPIRMVPAGDSPWGSFILFENRGRFRHLEVRGGSIGRFGGLQPKGMFNVYRSEDVVLAQCRFGHNSVSDDTVNLQGSQILVENCLFEWALFDGLDLDMCRGLVRDCRFVHCGNDGLDLMEADIEVQASHFEACGDKGISVGDGTRFLASQLSLADCFIGVQVKDDSVAEVVDSHFQSCRVAVDAYRKKWLYERGGTITLRRVTLHQNTRDVRLDKFSRARLSQTKAHLPQGTPGELILLD